MFSADPDRQRVGGTIPRTLRLLIHAPPDPRNRRADRRHVAGRYDSDLSVRNIVEARDEAETAYSLATNANDRWERVGHAAGMVEAFVGLGRVHEGRREWDRARHLYQLAVQVATEMDESPCTVSALRHLGLLLVRHFDYDAGAALLKHAAGIAVTMQRSVEFTPTMEAVAALEPTAPRSPH